MFKTNSCRAAGNLAACAFVASILLPWSVLRSQELLLVEDFETDGDGTRYEVEGGDAYEVDRNPQQEAILAI